MPTRPAASPSLEHCTRSSSGSGCAALVQSNAPPPPAAQRGGGDPPLHYGQEWPLALMNTVPLCHIRASVPVAASLAGTGRRARAARASRRARERPTAGPRTCAQQPGGQAVRGACARARPPGAGRRPSPARRRRRCRRRCGQPEAPDGDARPGPGHRRGPARDAGPGPGHAGVVSLRRQTAMPDPARATAGCC